MGCSSCAGGGARKTEKWVYTSPSGAKTIVGSKAEGDQLVSLNGGGSVVQQQ